MPNRFVAPENLDPKAWAEFERQGRGSNRPKATELSCHIE